MHTRLRPSAPDVVITDGEPLAQITIYDELTLLTRRHRGRWTQYPITPDALGDALSGVPQASGLLPPHTLGTGRMCGQPFTVVYVPPAVRTLRMEVGSYTIPVPPLVWAGCGTDYRIWALATRDYPTRGDEPLMVAPFPNCYKRGDVCWGSADPRPPATPSGLLRVLTLFLEESYFNLHLANGKSVQFPNSVVARWQQLAESHADTYPLDDLMPAECQLAWLLAGNPWGGAR
ncbi:MAG TPA: hypothetical protein PKK15_11945 [Kouleothrix sp.]|nr:hypothetical protein [Kouleothrix sp.]